MSAPPLEDFLAPAKKELDMLFQIKQVIIKITLHQKVCQLSVTIHILMLFALALLW